jgi:hypothetical protein
MCAIWGRIRLRIGIILTDLGRHQHGNSDPDRHQNDADPQHWVGKSNFVFPVYARNQNYVQIRILSIYRTGNLLSLTTTTGTRFLLHTLLKLEACNCDLRKGVESKARNFVSFLVHHRKRIIRVTYC